MANQENDDNSDLKKTAIHLFSKRKWNTFKLEKALKAQQKHFNVAQWSMLFIFCLMIYEPFHTLFMTKMHIMEPKGALWSLPYNSRFKKKGACGVIWSHKAPKAPQDSIFILGKAPKGSLGLPKAPSDPLHLITAI